MKQQTQQKKVVVLGGGYAGVNAALRLRLRDKRVQITLVNEQPFFVERIRNHQVAAGYNLQRRPLAKILGSRIGFCEGRATEIDPRRRTVRVKTSSGEQQLDYDLLVYALGSGLTRQLQGYSNHVNALGDAEELHAQLCAQRQREVVVLGAGLTGIELATELREKYPEAKITLADREAAGKHLSLRAQQHLRTTLTAMNITFTELAGETSNRFGNDALVVACTGFRPPPLAKESGFACDDLGRIRVDSALRAEGFDNVLVAGDAAAYGFGTHQALYAGCATAMPMGTYAGEAAAHMLAGKNPPEFRYGFTFQCISLGRRDGLIQFLDKYTGAPTGRVLVGRSAAIFKELICRQTIWLPMLERILRLPICTWRKTRNPHREATLTVGAT